MPHWHHPCQGVLAGRAARKSQVPPSILPAARLRSALTPKPPKKQGTRGQGGNPSPRRWSRCSPLIILGAGTSRPHVLRSCLGLCKSQWVFKVIFQHVRMPSGLMGLLFIAELFLGTSSTAGASPSPTPRGAPSCGFLSFFPLSESNRDCRVITAN